MAIYLNNINLNGNQLQKAVIHPLSTAPSTAAEGQVYYDLEDNAVYVNTSTTVNSPTWVNMQSGDLTGITITTDSGGGSPSSSTSGAAAFSILGTSGVGVTNSGNTITVTAVASEIDHDSLNNFASNEHFTQGNITTVGTIGTGVWQGTAIAHDYIGADAIDGTNIANDAVDTEHIADDAIEEEHIGAGEVKTDAIADANVTLAKLANIATDTFIGRTAANAGVPKALSKAEALAILNVEDGADVTDAANVKAALNANLGTVTFGDSDDQINFSGNVTITGVTTMTGGTVVNTTTNTAIKDTTIVLNDGIGTAENAADIGMIFDRGSLGNTFMGWDESEDEFIFAKTSTEGSADVSSAVGGGIAIADDNAYLHLKVGSLELANGGISIGGNLYDAVQRGGSNFSDVDDELMSAAAINDRITSFSYVTANQNTTGSAGSVANALTVDNATVQLNTGTTYNGSAALTLSAKTASISDGGTGLATADQIHTFVTGFGYTTNTGDVTLANAQTFTGLKTFSGGLILDDGTTAAPIIKWINSDNDEFTIFNNATGKLKFQQKLVGGTMTNRATLDENGLDVDNGLSIGGSAVHATDTTTTLGTSDTVVPSQKAVKTYVDAQGSSSSNTGGRNAFVLAHVGTGAGEVSGNTGSANGNNVFTITHAMGASRNYGVEVIRNSNNSGGGETVIVDVTRPTNTTIVITFAAAVVASDYTALVCKY